MIRTNWARNITFTAPRRHRPTSVAQLQAIVASAVRVRALGTGHSFNRIADTAGDLVSTAGLPPELDLDSAGATIRVSGGLRYSDVAEYLDGAGFALANLASLPHISVAGACATATHGSGNDLGNLATSVAALELVVADGSVVRLGREDDQFAGAVVALGALGIVTAVTLDIEPAYDIQQVVYVDLARERLRADAAEVFAAARSVSVFTDWRPDGTDRVWVKHRVGGSAWTPPPELFGAVRADQPLHPVPGMSPDSCTGQLGVPGPWHTRVPHFAPGFTPSSGDELQSEFFVRRDDLAAALAALDPIADLIAPALLISEIRTIAADDLWLSPSYRRDSAALHFTWRPDETAVLGVLRLIEERLAPFEARPHWGKVFTRPPARYERLPEFEALARGYDPAGKFRNEFVEHYVLR